MNENIYSIPVKDIKKADTTLANYKNKVLLIVNVASKCGFTPQYEGLEKLHRKYKERGFEVLGFPCNQFGAQEPGDEQEIQQFCKLTYDVNFPLFAKVNVNGGAVALGHAIGNSGGRVLTTLLYEMKRRGVKRGVAGLCLGGGNSVAMAVERA